MTGFRAQQWQRCETCIYCHPQTETGGQCRRHAQQLVMWTDTNHEGQPLYNAAFDWPAVAYDQWCGDYSGTRADGPARPRQSEG